MYSRWWRLEAGHMYRFQGGGQDKAAIQRPGFVRIFSFLKNNSASYEFIYEELHGYDISYMKYV